MKIVGLIALAIGLGGLLITLSMDTSVAAGELGRRVNNIGLMNDKQNLLLVFAAVAIVGALFASIGWNRSTMQAADSAAIVQSPTEHRKCPFCAEQIKLEAIVCRFCKKDVPANEVRAFGRQSSDIEVSDRVTTASDAMGLLLSFGCRVTHPEERKWEIEYPSGIKRFAYSPEQLGKLAVESTNAKGNKGSNAA